MEENKKNSIRRDLKIELLVLTSTSIILVLSGIFLIIQKTFEFWLLKPVGIFCVLFPIVLFFYYLKMQYSIEIEKSKFLDRILATNPISVLFYDISLSQVFVLNGNIPTLKYSEEELFSIKNNFFSSISEGPDLQKILIDLQKIESSSEENVLKTEWNFISKNENSRPFEIKLSKIQFDQNNINIIIFAEDIFDKKESENIIEKNKIRIAEIERYSILRSLGSGVAHDIANPLSAIKGRAQILKSRIIQKKMNEAQIIEGLDKIEKNAERINQTIQTLRFLTKDSSDEVNEEHFLKSIFKDIEMVWGQRLKTHGFEFEISVFNEESKIKCKKSQIEAAIFHIISNSFDQLIQNEDKWIKISSVEDDKKINIIICDSTNKLLPFGISTVKEIIENQNGTIQLETNNMNTKFIISFDKIENQIAA